ncbi:tyrosine-protein phosphatase [Nonlabens marinus]|uniref:protein-tyrosine-phosphatase n=1 Tax=Nonlabens marinus S1-08 TaxID=1454201 RepID=W8W0Q2_9FLAO|nr:CpsB/CapC family capsule biosynthesis tyrosine phosphatase [Nonlabens marinus]BAO56721.1 capsular polysaccharide synthesis enzyme Cap8C [Nonlabens marinus S1-08]
MIFFSKKYFIADLLEGIVDIHNHLLPGIDDGAPDLETTQEMIRLYKELGFKGVYTTPHTMEDYYGNDVASITTYYKETCRLLGDESSFLLGTSSEYMMDGAFGKLLESSEILTLPNKRLLFEFSYFQKPVEAEQLIFEMNHKEYKPILAHPERYRYLSVPEMMDLKQRGCELQLNLLSLSGHYGNDAKTKALELLENHAYDFVGTDAHKPEHLEKLKNIKLPKKTFNQFRQAISKHNSQFS